MREKILKLILDSISPKLFLDEDLPKIRPLLLHKSTPNVTLTKIRAFRAGKVYLRPDLAIMIIKRFPRIAPWALLFVVHPADRTNFLSSYTVNTGKTLSIKESRISFKNFAKNTKYRIKETEFDKAAFGADIINCHYRFSQSYGLDKFCKKMELSLDEVKAIWEGKKISVDKAVELFMNSPRKDIEILQHLIRSEDILEACLKLARSSNYSLTLAPNKLGKISHVNLVSLIRTINNSNPSLLDDKEKMILKSGLYENGMRDGEISRIRLFTLSKLADDLSIDELARKCLRLPLSDIQQLIALEAHLEIREAYRMAHRATQIFDLSLRERLVKNIYYFLGMEDWNAFEDILTKMQLPSSFPDENDQVLGI